MVKINSHICRNNFVKTIKTIHHWCPSISTLFIHKVTFANLISSTSLISSNINATRSTKWILCPNKEISNFKHKSSHYLWSWIQYCSCSEEPHIYLLFTIYNATKMLTVAQPSRHIRHYVQFFKNKPIRNLVMKYY